MRYLFFFSDSPINSGFFGMSLRNSTKLFTFYLFLLRVFIITNIYTYLHEYFDDNQKNAPYPYVLPTRLVILINNSIYGISLIMLFISSFSNKRIVLAFLGNVIGSINVLVNILMNVYYISIEKPEMDFRFKYFENFVTGYVLIYISILEVFLHYFLHSFCINLLLENYTILDYVERDGSATDNILINRISSSINSIELEQKFEFQLSVIK